MDGQQHAHADQGARHRQAGCVLVLSESVAGGSAAAHDTFVRLERCYVTGVGAAVPRCVVEVDCASFRVYVKSSRVESLQLLWSKKYEPLQRKKLCSHCRHNVLFFSSFVRCMHGALPPPPPSLPSSGVIYCIALWSC